MGKFPPPPAPTTAAWLITWSTGTALVVFAFACAAVAATRGLADASASTAVRILVLIGLAAGASIALGALHGWLAAGPIRDLRSRQIRWLAASVSIAAGIAGGLALLRAGRDSGSPGLALGGLLAFFVLTATPALAVRWASQLVGRDGWWVAGWSWAGWLAGALAARGLQVVVPAKVGAAAILAPALWAAVWALAWSVAVGAWMRSCAAPKPGAPKTFTPSQP